jgi:hypothetical protein
MMAYRLKVLVLCVGPVMLIASIVRVLLQGAAFPFELLEQACHGLLRKFTRRAKRDNAIL